MRGMITDELKDIAKNSVGIDLTQKQLRLIPYIQYSLINGGIISKKRLNDEEMEIIQEWVDSGFILKENTGMWCKIKVSKEFWDFMNKVLWRSYVN